MRTDKCKTNVKHVFNCRQILEERTRDIQRTSNIKEAYEKLLDDNCTLMQKRERERKEYVALLLKEQDKAEKKIGSIKAGYEEKLEKMIQKMVSICISAANHQLICGPTLCLKTQKELVIARLSRFFVFRPTTTSSR